MAKLPPIGTEEALDLLDRIGRALGEKIVRTVESAQVANEATCRAAVGKEIVVNSPSGRVIRGTVEKAEVYRGRCFRVTVSSYGQRFGPYEVTTLPR
jgi:ribosomal protein L35AE/L33A